MSQIKSLLNAVLTLKEGKCQIVPRLRMYKVNEAEESETLPQALATDPDDLRAIRVLVNWAELLLSGNAIFIAIGKYGWGKDSDPLSAVKRMRKNTGKAKEPYKLYIAHLNTTIFSIGNWEYPIGFEPILISESK